MKKHAFFFFYVAYGPAALTRGCEQTHLKIRMQWCWESPAQQTHPFPHPTPLNFNQVALCPCVLYPSCCSLHLELEIELLVSLTAVEVTAGQVNIPR